MLVQKIGIYNNTYSTNKKNPPAFNGKAFLACDDIVNCPEFDNLVVKISKKIIEIVGKNAIKCEAFCFPQNNSTLTWVSGLYFIYPKAFNEPVEKAFLNVVDGLDPTTIPKGIQIILSVRSFDR